VYTTPQLLLDSSYPPFRFRFRSFRSVIQSVMQQSQHTRNEISNISLLILIQCSVRTHVFGHRHVHRRSGEPRGEPHTSTQTHRYTIYSHRYESSGSLSTRPYLPSFFELFFPFPLLLLDPLSSVFVLSASRESFEARMDLEAFRDADTLADLERREQSMLPANASRASPVAPVPTVPTDSTRSLSIPNRSGALGGGADGGGG
jgi:hypothetical protein